MVGKEGWPDGIRKRHSEDRRGPEWVAGRAEESQDQDQDDAVLLNERLKCSVQPKRCALRLSTSVREIRGEKIVGVRLQDYTDAIRLPGLDLLGSRPSYAGSRCGAGRFNVADDCADVQAGFQPLAFSDRF